MLADAVPTSMVTPLRVVTRFPAWFLSFQSIATPTPARSVLQLLWWVVHCHDPWIVTAIVPSALRTLLADIEFGVTSGASAAAIAGTARAATRASAPLRITCLTRFDIWRTSLSVEGPRRETQIH